MSTMLLSIDPSSTRTGYAVMASATLVIEAGYITPRRQRDAVLQRIDAMAAGVAELLRKYQPTNVVLEVPSGRPGAGYHAGAKARLALYGMAVGEIRRTCLEVGPAEFVAEREEDEFRLVCPTERDWTKRECHTEMR